MCGIIAVLRRRSYRPVPAAADLTAPLEGASSLLASASASALAATLDELAGRVEGVDRALRGVPGITALLADRGLPAVLGTL